MKFVLTLVTWVAVGVLGITFVAGLPPGTFVNAWIQGAVFGVQQIPRGWYARGDGAGPGETGMRCLCGGGSFEGTFDEAEKFVVTSAPQGFQDTIGRSFYKKKLNCVNCMD